MINTENADDPPSLFLLNVLLDIVGALDTTMLLGIGCFIALLIFSALVSGSEVALFGLDQKTLKLFKEGSNITETRIVKVLKKPKKVLATILILNNLINVGIVIISTFILYQFIPPSNDQATTGLIITTLTLVNTFIIVLLGEFIPKEFAFNHPVKFAKITIRMIEFSSFILSPISFLLISLTNIIEKRISKKNLVLSIDDIGNALELTTDGTTTDKDKEIFSSVIKFASTTVPQVMQTRMDIFAIDSTLDYHQVLKQIRKQGYSRVPVYTESLDQIDGILYAKDLIPHIEKPNDFDWKTLLRPSYYVPENIKLDVLLKNFQKKRVHMAIIVDEYGGTAGLITLEDILEEIVGEINDEFDDEDINYQKIDDNTYKFEAKTSLTDFSKITNIDLVEFSEVRGESESLGGLILEMNKRIPKIGSKIKYRHFLFTIMQSDKKAIKEIKIETNK